MTSRQHRQPPKERSKLKNVALFTEENDPKAASTLPLAIITLPQTQPRRYFDPEAMQSLVESVKKDGILQPLLVRPVGEKYELVVGERRYRSAQAVGLTEVPVIIRDLSNEQATQYALTENLQREDLNPVEETEGILQLLALKLNRDREGVISLLNQLANVKRGVTDNVVRSEEQQLVEEIFQGIGRLSAESFRTHRLPLLNLPEEVLDALHQGKIEYTKAKEIAKVKDEQHRRVFLEEAIQENLSLSQIREKIKALQSQTDSFLSPKTEIQSLTRRLNQLKLWEKDPKKWKRIQSWLQKIEALINSEHLEEAAGLSQASLDPLEVEPDEEEIVGLSKATSDPIFEPVEPLVRLTKLELAKKIGIASRTLDNRINQAKKKQKTDEPIIEYEGQHWQYIFNPEGVGKIFELIDEESVAL